MRSMLSVWNRSPLPQRDSNCFWSNLKAPERGRSDGHSRSPHDFSGTSARTPFNSRTVRSTPSGREPKELDSARDNCRTVSARCVLEYLRRDSHYRGRHGTAGASATNRVVTVAVLRTTRFAEHQGRRFRTKGPGFGEDQSTRSGTE